MKIPIEPARLAPLFTWIYRAWMFTMRLDVQGYELRPGTPAVVAFWHNELFYTIWPVHQRCPDGIGVVSQSKDGEFVARVLECLGHSPIIRGSSNRGGVKALLKAKKIMEQEKRIIVFAMDGPKGPVYVPKDGIFFVAHRAGVPIIPVRAFSKKKYVFEKSWDKTIIPYPFTKASIHVGEPLYIEADELTPEVLEGERARLIEVMASLAPYK